jgi:ABC-2 type transport system ATP-binding protein
VSGEVAISVAGVSKRYRKYHERNQSVKATIMRGRRARYEEFWALQDVTLDITAGTTYGLVGENGSGKSTLLKCMARILRPDAGALTVHGKVSALLELGAGFHPELSGRENVFLNGALLGMSQKAIRARFDDIVGFAGLEDFIDAPVKNYSSGMYVRLGFAVAIHVDPDVLLVDEVLAVGDAEFQERCTEKFGELRNSGKTIVIVSHALESIRNLCDEAAFLEHGVLRGVGPAPQICDQYLDEVHSNRADGSIDGTRFGSGEARIEQIELLGADGRPTHDVRTGDEVTFRIHYQADEPIERPIFGLGISRVDAIHVTGPNTKDADVIPEKISGPGMVDLHVDRLLLVPGTYEISASLYDFHVSHAYDSRRDIYRFDVGNGEPRERFGVVSLGGTWDIVPTEEQP